MKKLLPTSTILSNAKPVELILTKLLLTVAWANAHEDNKDNPHFRINNYFKWATETFKDNSCVKVENVEKTSTIVIKYQETEESEERIIFTVEELGNDITG